MKYDYSRSGMSIEEALFDAHKRMIDDIMEEYRWQQRKKEIVEEVLQRVNISVVDAASPVIEEISQEIEKMIKRK